MLATGSRIGAPRRAPAIPINAPTEDKPFYQTLTIDYLGNVADGRPVEYLNIPMEELKALIIAQLQDGEIVWFGSDVGHSGERDMGIWSRGCFDFDGTFGMSFGMTKEERLGNRESAMSHAMCVTGVSLDENGCPVKWKIENSWSDEHGDKGYYIMDDEWFDNFVYQAVVRRKYKRSVRSRCTSSRGLRWEPLRSDSFRTDPAFRSVSAKPSDTRVTGGFLRNRRTPA